ncbi:MAG: hypothetical protein JWM91_402 [Rhodospirillales bacterium]|nr:hypothetical protein [Rhodospirillales bacterium]
MDNGGPVGGGDRPCGDGRCPRGNAWCREQGVYPTELQRGKENATAALSEIPEERATPQETRDAVTSRDNWD